MFIGLDSCHSDQQEFGCGIAYALIQTRALRPEEAETDTAIIKLDETGAARLLNLLQKNNYQLNREIVCAFKSRTKQGTIDPARPHWVGITTQYPITFH